MAGDIDQEIDAIRAVLAALEPLPAAARLSVLNYAVERLDINFSTSQPTQATPPPTVVSPSPAASPSAAAETFSHIKELKEAKKPRSNNEMAALVAYYLAHDAPPTDRRDTINQQDIETYFRIADYPLPEKPQFTLPNAKAAGYLDMAGGGEYRLNPVGHNLVKHSLPRSGQSNSTRKKKTTKKKAAKKKTAKRKTKKKAAKKKSTARKRNKKK